MSFPGSRHIYTLRSPCLAVDMRVFEQNVFKNFLHLIRDTQKQNMAAHIKIVAKFSCYCLMTHLFSLSCKEVKEGLHDSLEVQYVYLPLIYPAWVWIPTELQTLILVFDMQGQASMNERSLGWILSRRTSLHSHWSLVDLKDSMVFFLGREGELSHEP